MCIRARVLVLIAVALSALSINSAHATVGGVNSSTGSLPIGANGSVFLSIDPSGVTSFLNGATTTASINSLTGDASFASNHITIPSTVSGYRGLMLDGGQDSFGSAITRRTVRLYTEQGGGMAGVQVSQDETNPFATWQMNVDGAGNFQLVHPGMSANIFVTPGNANPANGRVGINTTVPQATLDVAGTVNIRGAANPSSPSSSSSSANPVLTVNGSLAIMGVATVGSDCSSAGPGAVAQDGTGKLLSCQSTASSGQASYAWDLLAPVGQMAGYCAQDWGGKINFSTLSPMRFDWTPKSCGPVAGDPSGTGVGCHVGCGCPGGWTLVLTGTLFSPNVNSPTQQEYFFTCVKD